MLATLGMLVALAQPGLHLALAPWKGADLQTTTGAAAKYRLSIGGKPGSSVRLRARKLATGWIGAFCTKAFCAAMAADVTLPSSGHEVLQFELISTGEDAAPKSGAEIVANDHTVLEVPAARHRP